MRDAVPFDRPLPEGEFIIGKPVLACFNGEEVPQVAIRCFHPETQSVTVSLLGVARGLELQPIEFSGTSDYGESASSVSDLDGDHFRDIAIGDPSWKSEQVGVAGALFVFSGRDHRLLYAVNGEVEGDRFGACIASVSDVDGDAVGDLLVGAPQYTYGAANGAEGYDYRFLGSGYVALCSGRTGRVIRRIREPIDDGRMFGKSLSVGSCAAGDSEVFVSMSALDGGIRLSVFNVKTGVRCAFRDFVCSDGPWGGQFLLLPGSGDGSISVAVHLSAREWFIADLAPGGAIVPVDVPGIRASFAVVGEKRVPLAAVVRTHKASSSGVATPLAGWGSPAIVEVVRLDTFERVLEECAKDVMVYPQLVEWPTVSSNPVVIWMEDGTLVAKPVFLR